MRKVLWLTSWYPNISDPFTGDFIKRQAEAVSEIQPLKIVFAGKNDQTSEGQQVAVENVFPNLQEHILYYSSTIKNNFISRCRSLFTYFRIHRDFINRLKQENGLPDIVHVQVAFKAGLIALYLKWKYGIPYVLTEHWTGYYRQAEDNLFNRSLLEKYLTRLIIKHSAQLITVSDALGTQIQNNWIRIPFKKISNVVNTGLFYPQEIIPGKKFRFIHVSTLQYRKNPEGIVRAFNSLIQEGLNAELVLVGPVNSALEKMITDTGLPSNTIRCTGEITYEQVGVELRNSSAMILFSYLENMPCVMLESLCSGVPVIATKVGGIPEEIGDDNGILINAGDEKELLGAMRLMMDKIRSYERKKFSLKATSHYSYQTIAKEITSVYNSVLNRT
jgi:glycosyltransferase involved in cell wall biosynthesis